MMGSMIGSSTDLGIICYETQPSNAAVVNASHLPADESV